MKTNFLFLLLFLLADLLAGCSGLLSIDTSTSPSDNPDNSIPFTPPEIPPTPVVPVFDANGTQVGGF